MKKIFYPIVFSISFLTSCSLYEKEEFEIPLLENIEIILKEGITTLENNIDGYSISLEGDFALDDSLENVRTRLVSEQEIIDVYYDDFKGSIHSRDTYFSYGNSSVLSDPYHIITNKNKYKKNGIHYNIIEWKRKPLKHSENDFPYYTSIEVALSKYKVYTFLIKSKNKNSQKDSILDSFKTKNPIYDPSSPYFSSKEKKWNDETSRYFNDTFSDDSSLQWGIFDGMKLDDTRITDKLELRLDYSFDTILRYQMIGKDVFPSKEMKFTYEEGKTVQLTMQYNDGGNILYEILEGKHDQYFKEYSKAVKEFEHPILFRLNNEMNGDWVRYSAIHTSKDTDIYKEAWRYIYNFFENEQVDNLIWIWNPNHHSKPEFKWNHTLLYFPGEEYVDIIGLTAYNTGNYYKGENWTDFKTLYDEIYYQYIEWFEHPFMISEFGSSSIGGDKIKWIDDMFSVIEKYDRVKIAIWWSWQDLDSKGNPARIYFLDESQETINSFKKGLKE